MSGAKTSKETLDQLCEDMEEVLARLERAGIQGDLGPVLNEERDPSYWLEEQPGAPKPALEDEKRNPRPSPMTSW